MTAKKVGVISLGCAKNLVDTEVMLGLLMKAGYEITAEASSAHILIVNTCGFIGDAKEESINTLLEMAEYKNKGNCSILLAAGCLSQRYGEELLKEIPELDGVVGTGCFDRLPEILAESLEGNRPVYIEQPRFLYDHTFPRVVSTSPHMAYVKIAEGCNHRCSFCIIPKLRGKYRSREPRSVVQEVEVLAWQGVKELNLIAQDTTGYGRDLGPGRANLPALLRELAQIQGINWIRVLYGYPGGISGDLIQIMSQEDKICNYLDIPLQHAHGEILKRMRRPFRKTKVQEQMEQLRLKIPGITLRSSFIVGFPGETEEHFEVLYSFLEEVRFDRVGIFRYSLEEGTTAALMGRQVSEEVKAERYQRLMELQKNISLQKNRELLSSTLEVLMEGKVPKVKNLYVGRYRGQAPEVDGVVYVKSTSPLKAGEIVQVKISSVVAYDLQGNNVNND
ncbi:30S ribosomal protein S12 methylthiotransferase RimO [Candidatus Contubernalis alkaliaceticus]|uniref:30S ribosomal protein S12 methylthiotransferase RimO n=1 Tax=Candidatus Contubernalis alkaliaceticus TaxID=338645 RepID=UPI001F4C3276|nr:30S ribosomal protein S12 methylthiotransferase RimO [Candidatus Contubernalis alkalaceticus]UNC91863.1 30S ribosomal protein S12 methylthiotransferase RimO [Candidatus Contubernalis alkalaceticus]